jgi:hypothetical protein
MPPSPPSTTTASTCARLPAGADSSAPVVKNPSSASSGKQRNATKTVIATFARRLHGRWIAVLRLQRNVNIHS